MASPTTQSVSSLISAVKGEIADRIIRGNKLEFIVPRQPNGTLDFSATVDADANRIGIVHSVPEAARQQVFEAVLGAGPQDSEQLFAIVPNTAERGMSFKICAL